MTKPLHLRLSRLTHGMLVAMAAWSSAAPAADPVLPTGAQVVHGQARIAVSGPAMTVTTGRHAAIDWRSFSIGPEASVRFQQPDASSQVLNRVLGPDPSRILGRLSSNGEVWLLNPAGVLFGLNARVDVAGLVASSLGLAPADWAAGRRTLSVSADATAAPVVNEGTLRSTAGGRILLAGSGPAINDGTIDAPAGRGALLSGATVDLADSTQPDIAVRIVLADGMATNTGTLVAAGGAIDLQAAMVNQSGIVRADALDAGPGGTVRLRAQDALELGSSSLTSATGAPGGRIELVGGTQQVKGGVDASSPTGVGGQVTLAGPRIALLDGAVVQADGARGGGEIRVGQADAALAADAAQAVYIGVEAYLSANALREGDGGRIQVWSDAATRAYGSFSARGGPDGGNGGTIETSGIGLDASPSSVDTFAPKGGVGRWVLDPTDVRIVPGSGGTGIGPGPHFSPIAPGATVGAETIASALLSNNVTISTGAAGTDPGTITMDGVTLYADLPDVALSTGTLVVERTLTLDAASRILLESSAIYSTSGRLHLRLLADNGDADGITLTGSRIDTRGDLILHGTSLDISASAVAADTIRVSADRINFGAPLVIDAETRPILRARASGDDLFSLIVYGVSGNVDRFTSLAGSNSFVTGGGARWALWASDPARTTADGLGHDFKQYAALHPLAAPLGSGNGLLYALRAPLDLTADGVPLDKVYDGTTTLPLTADQLDRIALTGFIDGDEPTFDRGLIASLTYNSRNAGAEVPITATRSGPLPEVFDGDLPVYGYAFAGRGLAGTISPAPVSAASVAVADKVYDGTTAATVEAWSLAGVVPGDAVNVASGGARFDSAAAGIDKPVRATVVSLGGADAPNYRPVPEPALTQASITPAELTYRATPTTVVAGRSWPPLAGAVTGFVGGESLATATSGSLQFDTPATAGSPPGAYPMIGGGLAAANYRLVQDPANATALRVLPAEVADGPLRQPHSVPWPLPERPSGPGDVIVVAPPTVVGFRPMAFDWTSPRQLRAEVDAQQLAMAHAFGPAFLELNLDPSVAQLPACSDVGGALLGECIVTPELKRLMASEWSNLAASPEWAAFGRDGVFELGFWPRGGLSLDLSQAMLFLPGDGTLARHAALGQGLVTPLTTAMTASMLTDAMQPAGGGMAMSLSGMVAAPPPGAAGGVAAGGAGATASSATAPPAVIVAAAPSLEVQTVLEPTAAVRPAAATPVCVTQQQRQSGECQREAELDALREAAQRCAQAPRAEQPACLFSERVKIRLQQREREVRLLSETLQARDAREAVLPDIRRKWALVIGVEQYPRVDLGGQPVRMPSAGHDARAIARELSTEFGYITSELVNPTRAQVVQRLNMLAAIAQPSDSLLVFFSGYGFTVAQGEDAVWALTDADPSDGRTVLSHADLARLLELIDARQVALISDSALAGQLRKKPVDYDPKAAPDASGLLGRRATVALTSGGNLPLGSVPAHGLSDFAAQLLGVLQRVSTWHIGGRIFREVQAPLIRAGRPFIPQYGAASESLHQQRADYVFERRVITDR